MKQFAVIGLGTFGTAVAKGMASKGVQVMVIDKDEQKIQDISEYVTQAVSADSTDEKILKELGVAEMDGVIVAIGDNLEASILTTLILKELGVKQIIVKGIDLLHAKVLQKIGANRIVFPEQDMGEKLSEIIVSPDIIEEIKLSPEYNMAEIIVPKAFIGKTIKDLDVGAKLRLHVIGIKRNQPYVKENGDTDFREELLIAPSANEVFQEGDIIIVVGKYSDIDNVKNVR